MMTKSKIILSILLLSNLFSETLFPGIFGEELKQLIIDEYKTTSTLGYNTSEILCIQKLTSKMEIN